MSDQRGPRDTLARTWLRDVLQWARWAESHHPDPVGHYHDAAIDALLVEIDWSIKTGGTMTRGRLVRLMRQFGRDRTKTERRRRSKLHQRPLSDQVDRRAMPPERCAELNEATER